MPTPKRGKRPPKPKKPVKLAKAKQKPGLPTIEQAMEWKAPIPVDAKEYAAAQRQYYFGASPERMRFVTALIADDVADAKQHKLRDRVEALKGLAEWKKIEMAFAKMAQDEIQFQQLADIDMPMPSDEVVMKRIKLMVESVGIVPEHMPAAAVIEDAEVIDDDEMILPLEGVG